MDCSLVVRNPETGVYYLCNAKREVLGSSHKAERLPKGLP